MTIIFDFDSVNGLWGKELQLSLERIICLEPHEKRITIKSWFDSLTVLASLSFTRLQTSWWSPIPRVRSVMPATLRAQQTEKTHESRCILIDTDQGTALWDPLMDSLDLFDFDLMGHKIIYFSTVLLEPTPENFSPETFLCLVTEAGEVLWWNMAKHASCLRLHLYPVSPIIQACIIRVNTGKAVLVLVDASPRLYVLSLTFEQAPTLLFSTSVTMLGQQVGIAPLDCHQGCPRMAIFSSQCWCVAEIKLEEVTVEALQAFELPMDWRVVGLQSSLLITENGSRQLSLFDASNGHMVARVDLAVGASIDDVRLLGVSNRRFISIGLVQREFFLPGEAHIAKLPVIHFEFIIVFNLLADFDFKHHHPKSTMSFWNNLVHLTELPLEGFPNNWNELRRLFDQLNTCITKDNEKVICVLMLYLVAFGQPLRLNQVAELYHLPLSLQIEASYYVSIDCGIPQKVSLGLLQGFLLRDRITKSMLTMKIDLNSTVERLQADPNIPKLYFREYMEFLSAGKIRVKNSKPIVSTFDEQFLTNWSLPSLEGPSMIQDEQIFKLQARSLQPPQLEAEKPLQLPSALISPARISSKSRLATENLLTPTTGTSSPGKFSLAEKQNLSSTSPSSSQPTTPTKTPSTLHLRKRKTRKNRKKSKALNSAAEDKHQAKTEIVNQKVKTPERPKQTTVESPGKYSFRTSTIIQMKSPPK